MALATADLEASSAGLRLDGPIAGDAELLDGEVDPSDAEVREPRVPELEGGVIRGNKQSSVRVDLEGVVRAVFREGHLVAIGQD